MDNKDNTLDWYAVLKVGIYINHDQQILKSCIMFLLCSCSMKLKNILKINYGQSLVTNENKIPVSLPIPDEDAGVLNLQ